MTNGTLVRRGAERRLAPASLWWTDDLDLASVRPGDDLAIQFQNVVPLIVTS
jgi:hypothetical protein